MKRLLRLPMATLAAASLVVLASPASAQSSTAKAIASTETAPAWAVGTNLMSCRSWVANKPGANQIEPLQRIAPLDWLYGYLNGQSAALRLPLLTGLHPSDIGDWLDVYCRAHPEDDVQRASAVLSGDLVRASSKTAQAAAGPRVMDQPRARCAVASAKETDSLAPCGAAGGACRPRRRICRSSIAINAPVVESPPDWKAFCCGRTGLRYSAQLESVDPPNSQAAGAALMLCAGQVYRY